VQNFDGNALMMRSGGRPRKRWILRIGLLALEVDEVTLGPCAVSDIEWSELRN
jgi:hypothetical protein